MFNAHLRSSKTDVDPSFKLTDYSNPSIYSDRFVNGRDKKIQALAQKTVGKRQNLNEIIRSLYDFALGYLTYGRPTEGLYTYKQAMEERTTDCGGFSTFLMSLLQSQGIPTRLVSGFIIKDNVKTKLLSSFDICDLNFDILLMHAWFEAQLPDKTWLPMDSSIEWRRKHGLTKRQGGFGFIPADRLVTSFGEDFSIKPNNKTYKIDLLQNPVYL